MTALQRTANLAIGIYRRLVPQYHADGLSVSGRNLSFLTEIDEAWRSTTTGRALPGGIPDVRWRAHIAVWAARNGMRLEGDLVECGVFTGLLASVICRSIEEFGQKRFWLFDTFEGVPVETVEGAEKDNAVALNRSYYGLVDSEQIVRDRFRDVPAVRIIKGILPQSLQSADLERVSYLSIDLNNTPAEIGVAEALWDKVVPGAIVLLDDFGFAGHEQQHLAWEAFCAKRGVSIATLPTGQGLIIKPPA